MKSDNAIWISPDGKKIVYATFNDSQVQSVQWKLYGDGRDANVNPYPTEAFMRYPKVCTKYGILNTSCIFYPMRPAKYSIRNNPKFLLQKDYLSELHWTDISCFFLYKTGDLAQINFVLRMIKGTFEVKSLHVDTFLV